MSDNEKDIVKKVNGEPAAELAGSEDEELATDEAQAIAGGALHQRHRVHLDL